MASADAVARALGGRKQGHGWLCHCPVPGHGRGRGDRTPSLSVVTGQNGTLLLHCHGGCGFPEVWACLRQRGLVEQKSGRAAATVATVATGVRRVSISAPLPALEVSRQAATVATGWLQQNQRRTVVAQRIWQDAAPAAGTPVATSLHGRGIQIEPPEALRYAVLRHKPTGLRLPAMVAAVRDRTGAIIAVHRTYLAADGHGKADVDPNKMMLGPVAGGGVWLGPPADAVLLSEGIESGVSAMQLCGLPACATLSTSGLQAIVLPTCVRDVLICADSDVPGLAAAYYTASKLTNQGRRVKIAMPPRSTDFNDLLFSRSTYCDEFHYST